MTDNNDPIESLKLIYRLLDSIRYKSSGSVYTIEDDQMGVIFFCKDVAEMTVRTQKNPEEKW